MARLTTDKYKVRVAFNSPREKAQHLFRSAYIVEDVKKTSLQHSETADLHDTFVMTRSYPTAKSKFTDYFHKGSHTKSYDVKLLRSTPTGDEFDVEVSYAGGEKQFLQVFNVQFLPVLGIWEADKESTKTKNLGVKHKRLAGDDIKIIQAYIEEVLSKTNLTKHKTVPKEKDRGLYKTTVVSPSAYFFHDTRQSIVCVHLYNLKVGIFPKKNNMDQINILVHSLNGNIAILGKKTQKNFKSLKIINDHKLDEIRLKDNMMSAYWRNRSIIPNREFYEKDLSNLTVFNLSDPDFFDQLVEFFEELRTFTYCPN